MKDIEITLSFSGRSADDNEIDFYDISQALIGFQRSLALTTHLVLNGEIITQAPALKGAEVIAFPPTPGSWKFSAGVAIVATGLYHLGTAPKDSPIGHLVRSGYDYVISEALGFHVDYEKSLGQQYEELKKTKQPVPRLPVSKFDSLIEKCENSIKEMHRPLVKSETAKQAVLQARLGDQQLPIGRPLTAETYEYIAYTERSPDPSSFVGKITSYNVNTYKSRVFVGNEGRPIPFELADTARNIRSVSAITASLRASARQRLATIASSHRSTGMAWFLNVYHCDRCRGVWTDEWWCTCEDECPHCGLRDMSPVKSKDLTDLVLPDGEEFVVMRSSDSAEDDPDYEEIGRFPTRAKAQEFLKLHDSGE